jgi:electron transport complex protein RnfE
VANCAVLGRAEAFAAKNPILPSGMDGLMMGLGFTFALTTIGAVREILGAGTLFADAHLLLGSAFSFMELKLIPDYKGFLLMILPPGGFLAVGFLIAGKRIIDRRRQAVPAHMPDVAPAIS